MRKLFLLILSLLSFSAYSKGYYDFNDNCEQAYIATYKLDLDCANEFIKKEKVSNPNNMIVQYVEGVELFLNSFISPDYTVFKTNKALIENKMTTIKTNKADSPYFYFCQAELYFYLSVLSTKFGDYFGAVRYGKSATELYKECLDKYPSFVPAKMGYGYINVVLSQIPSKYSWILRMMGISADEDKGVKALDMAYSYSTLKDTMWRKQNTILLSSLRRIYEKRGLSNKQFYLKYAAWLEGRYDPLSVFVVSSQLNYMGQTDKAIEILDKSRQNRFFAGSSLEYMIGSMMLERLDKNAITYLSRAAKNCSKENISYQEMIQKMAWYYLINGDTNKYKELTYKINPQEVSNIEILKARLLFDGGYIAASKYKLLKLNSTTLSKAAQAEYHYRMGRILEKENAASQALSSYDKSINSGIQTRYTASSALKAGNIYKEMKNTSKANEYYRKALKMDFTEYYDEIMNDVKRAMSTVK